MATIGAVVLLIGVALIVIIYVFPLLEIEKTMALIFIHIQYLFLDKL